MKTQRIILILLLGVVNLLQAQSTDAELQNKYFTARNRLKKWFLTVGNEEGMCMIPDMISFGEHKWLSHKILLPNGHDSTVLDANWKSNSENIFSSEPWGTMTYDNPEVYLGRYLGVLSTEYWLLKYYKRSSEELRAVENELYYALATIERLDKSAESYFNTSHSPSTDDFNGFIRRDDIPDNHSDRINKYQGFFGTEKGELQLSSSLTRGPVYAKTKNWYWDTTIQRRDTIYVPDDDATPSSSFGHYHSVIIPPDTQIVKKWNFYNEWDYKLPYNMAWDPLRDDLKEMGSGRKVNEMSQDQLISLFFGLKCVQQFVDDGLVVKPRPTDSSHNLIAWTRVFADKFMTLLTKDVDDIRFYDPESYSKRQQKACASNRCPTCHADTSGCLYENGLPNPAKGCKECAMPEYYQRYGAQWPYYVFNPVIFKSGNYVLTNPIQGDRPVFRGPYAFAFGYPLEQLGESLASGPGDTKDYPGVSLTLNNDVNVARVFADLGWAGFNKEVIALPFVYLLGDDISGNKAMWDDMAMEISFHCLGTDQFGLDETSLCLFGRVFNPSNPEWWETAWKYLGDSARFAGGLWREFASNSGIPNRLIMWLEAAAGTWSQENYANFMKVTGIPYAELLRANIQGVEPVNGKSFYQKALSSFDCESNWGDSFPFDRDIFSASMIPSKHGDAMPKNNGEMDSRLDYMLLYNMYRIAEIKWWGAGLKSYSDIGCPCHVDTIQRGSRFLVSAVPPRTYYDSAKHDVFYTYNNQKVQSGSYFRTKDANPIHALYGIRQPEWLNHYYQINSGKTLEVRRDLVICGAETRLNANGTLIIDTGSFENSPNEIIVRNGGLLNCRDSSILRVNNNCRLVIETTGKLIYSPHTRIILDGPNAVLHIRGTLELKPGATFQIEGGSAGKGYIIWENNEWWGADNTYATGKANLIAGDNSKMIISHTDHDHLALAILGAQGFTSVDNLAELNINNCKVTMGHISKLMTRGAKTFFTNVFFEGNFEASQNPEFDWHITSRGLQILGRQHLIKDCRINNCVTGISIFTEDANFFPLTLDHTEISNCIIGIKNDGSHIRFMNQSIIWQFGQGKYGNAHYIQAWKGIEAAGSQGTNFIDHSVIDVPYINFDRGKLRDTLPAGERTYGLDYHASGRYMIKNSTISNCDVGVRGYQGFLRPTCTLFGNDKTMLDLRKNVMFNSNNDGWNDYSWEFNYPKTPTENHKFLNARFGSYVYLDGGKNSIHGHHKEFIRFIDAGLNPNQPFVPSLPGAAYANSLDASGNMYHIHYYGLSDDVVASNGTDQNVNIWETAHGTAFDLKREPYYSSTETGSKTRVIIAV